MGYSKGLLASAGIALISTHPIIKRTLGVSEFVSYALAAVVTGTAVCMLLDIAVFIHITHERSE